MGIIDINTKDRGKGMDIVNIYGSAIYREDTSFTNEGEKEEYYSEEYWRGSDYLVIPTEKTVGSLDFRVDKESNEIVTNDFDGKYCEYTHIIRKFILEEYEDHFTELENGNGFKAKDDINYNPDKPYIMCTGGTGYRYYRHQYKG